MLPRKVHMHEELGATQAIGNTMVESELSLCEDQPAVPQVDEAPSISIECNVNKYLVDKMVPKGIFRVRWNTTAVIKVYCSNKELTW